MDGILLLEDGRTFSGMSYGAQGPVVGEVVFNTSMSGYQEILTDPSYCGQIVVMTAPQIGNVGVNERDMESKHPWAVGFIMRDASPRVSNWRAESDLGSFLKKYGIPALNEVDTRTLTRHLRTAGVMKGILGPASMPLEKLQALLDQAPSMEGLDLIPQVSCRAPYRFTESGAYALSAKDAAPAPPGERPRVVAVDYGIKRSILRNLVDTGFEVLVVPGTSTAEQILEFEPDGIFLSNGPGDPAAATYAIEAVRELLGQKPIFGICLGHQILALAMGGSTYKLKFGHRGANHPVQDLQTKVVAITSQNHGFAVSSELPPGAQISHLNLNDQTVAGITCPEVGAFGLQNHPEAGPGPRDATVHFSRFRALIEGWPT